MKNINLNKPKKIHSDKDVTIFRDKNGHEIRVAHSALSPKMLKELKALPVHGEEPKKMADGGDPSDEEDLPAPSSQLAQDSQPQAKSNTPLDVEPIQPGEDDGSNGGSESQSQAQGQDDQVDSSQAIPSPSADEQPEQAPQTPMASVISSPLDSNTIANNLNQEYAKFKQDWGSGTIKPTTMADFWSKTSDGQPRGTLGKIGMFFGMLASSIGSGLTHQPNMLLQAMQKQIDNDLQAQEQTKSNQFNAFNAAMQHAQALSGVNLQSLQAKLAQAEAANQPVLAKKYQSEIAVNQANQKLVATNQAKQALILSVLQHTLGQVNNMPPGPMKNQATHAHQLLSQAADAHVVQGNQQTAHQIEANWRQNNMALSMAGPEGAALSQWQTQHHVPFVGDTSVPIPENQRQQLISMNTLDQKGKDLLNYIDQHQGLDLNRWNPQDRATAQQKVEEMKNFYNDSIKGGALTEGRLGWYDKQFSGDKSPLDILPQLLGQTAKFREMIKSNEARRDELLAGYGGPKFPEGSTPLEAPVGQSESAPQIKTMGGIKYRKVKGGWQKVG